MTVVPHFVGVFGAEGSLAVDDTCPLRMLCTKQVGHHWLHAGASKECGRIIFWHDWTARDDGMPPFSKKV